MLKIDFEKKLQLLDLSAYAMNGEPLLQPAAATSREDAEDRICSYWDKVNWVVKNIEKKYRLHEKEKEVLRILASLLDAQCRLRM